MTKNRHSVFDEIIGNKDEAPRPRWSEELTETDFLFICLKRDEDPKELFKLVCKNLKYDKCDMEANGTIWEEGNIIKLEDGRNFICLSFNGDLEVHAKVLLQGTNIMNRTHGSVAEDGLLLSDNSKVELSSIEIEYY